MKYGTFKYGAVRYGLFPLVRKTWTQSDNYAANGTTELARLLSNIEVLAGILAEEFGFATSLSLPSLTGYGTLPFASTMNQVEATIDVLKQFDIDWAASRVWAAGNVPTAADPNRWETNGVLAEENIVRGRRNFKPCGSFRAGRVR